jgi:hypothetical protein
MGSKSEEVKNCFSAFGLSLNADEIKKKNRLGAVALQLESQILRRRRSGRLWLEASLGRKLARVHLNT